MSLATFPAAIVETILTGLAAIFLAGANGNPTAAREAAARMIAAYRPETEDELRLAANIVSFSFQGLQAIAQAAEPGLPITRILRLRGGAVSLSREAAKAERRLVQLQKNRQQPIEAHPAPIQPEPAQAEPAQPEPKIEKAVALTQETATITGTAKAKGVTWTKAYEDRQADLRIAASIKRAEAKTAAMSAAYPSPGKQLALGRSAP